MITFWVKKSCHCTYTSSLPEAKKVMIKLLAGYKTWPPTNQEGRWQNWRKIWPSASSLGLLVPLLLPCWLYILSLEFQAATLTRTLEPFAPFPGPPAPGLGVGSHCLSPQFLVWVLHWTAHHAEPQNCLTTEPTITRTSLKTISPLAHPPPSSTFPKAAHPPLDARLGLPSWA